MVLEDEKDHPSNDGEIGEAHIKGYFEEQGSVGIQVESHVETY